MLVPRASAVAAGCATVYRPLEVYRVWEQSGSRQAAGGKVEADKTTMELMQPL